MATYRIVCTDQEPSGHSHQHAHIVAVGIGDDPSKVQRKWTLDEVLGAIDRGDLFYTKGMNTGKVALVAPRAVASTSGPRPTKLRTTISTTYLTARGAPSSHKALSPMTG